MDTLNLHMLLETHFQLLSDLGLYIEKWTPKMGF